MDGENTKEITLSNSFGVNLFLTRCSTIVALYKTKLWLINIYTLHLFYNWYNLICFGVFPTLICLSMSFINSHHCHIYFHTKANEKERVVSQILLMNILIRTGVVDLFASDNKTIWTRLIAKMVGTTIVLV